MNRFLVVIVFQPRNSWNKWRCPWPNPSDYSDEEIYSEPIEVIPSYILEINEKLDEVLNQQTTLNEKLEKLLLIKRILRIN